MAPQVAAPLAGDCTFEVDECGWTSGQGARGRNRIEWQRVPVRTQYIRYQRRPSRIAQIGSNENGNLTFQSNIHSTVSSLKPALYSLYCTMCSLQLALCNLHSTVCSLQPTLYRLHSIFCTLQAAVNSLHSTGCTPLSVLSKLHSTVCSLQTALYSLHSTTCTSLSELYNLHSTIVLSTIRSLTQQ